ncbi:MAG: glycosyltransferase [Bacteroidales bacterium]
MVKISVIIPVFNTGSYLSETLNSIINQTIREIEIIIINDGSTDNSGEIIEQYRNSDTRIISVRQDNAGQATARNHGMALASGEYIYFMDSDDMLNPEALEECYQKAYPDNLDIVFFDAVSFSTDGYNTDSFNYLRCGELEDRIYSGPEISDILLRNNGFRVAPWLQIYRRKFLEDKKLLYQKTTHEDELFTTLAFLQAERTGFINKAYFNRRLRDSSVVTSPFKMKNLYAYSYIMSEIKAFSEGKDKVIQNLCQRFIRRISNGLITKMAALNYHERLNGLIRLHKNGQLFYSANIIKLIIPRRK